MAPDAVAIVRASFDARTLAEGASYWHDDVEYHEDPLWPGSGTYQGRETVTRRWEEYVDVLGPATEMSVQDVRDAGDALVALVRVRGTAQGSGAPHDHLWGYVVRVEDDKLRYIRAFYDPDEALRAAGLA
jgi:ketosteroid isomerase-like protein